MITITSSTVNGIKVPSVPLDKEKTVVLWLFDGITYRGYEANDELPATPASTGVPQEVTMRQARQALADAGLLDAVSAQIATIVDPVAKRKAQIEWEFSSTVERHRGLVSQMGTALGLTATQIDNLFITAATL